jgi:hypothetical protein
MRGKRIRIHVRSALGQRLLEELDRGDRQREAAPNGT